MYYISSNYYPISGDSYKTYLSESMDSPGKFNFPAAHDRFWNEISFSHIHQIAEFLESHPELSNGWGKLAVFVGDDSHSIVRLSDGYVYPTGYRIEVDSKF